MLKTFVAAGFVSAMLFFATPAQAQHEWSMPTGYSADSIHTENIRQFAEEISKATDGKLKITVHDGGSLFKANEIKRAVQSGRVDIGEIIISAHSNESPVFGVDSIPFLATSYPEAKKLWAVSKTATENRLAKQGIKVLYAVPWPPQGVFSAVPLTSTADLKGVKWRAYNPDTTRIAQLVGARPVTLQAAELTQALASGTVSAFMTSGATGFDSKVWKQIKYYYDVNAWLPKNLVIVSRKAFDALDKPTQEVVLKASSNAETRGWKVSEEKDAWYKAQLLKNGMIVEKGSEQLLSDFRKIGLTMIADWITQSGAEGQAIIDNYRK